MSNGHPTLPSFGLKRIFEIRGPSSEGGGISTSGAHPAAPSSRPARASLTAKPTRHSMSVMRSAPMGVPSAPTIPQSTAEHRQDRDDWALWRCAHQRRYPAGDPPPPYQPPPPPTPPPPTQPPS